MDIKSVAAQYEQYVIDMRRHFHAHPEVSGQEVETSKRIKEELDKMGVEWRQCGGNGVLATIRGAKPGKTILLRGDMDGLAVQEETGAEFASRNPGVMHACGHDCHTAMMLTAAQILKDMKEDLCGTVQLAYQPAEEIAVGAKAMIADGALEGVDACFGIHVWANVPAGHVSVEAGPRMASADQFTINIQGKGSHGAEPHRGIDAAVIASAIVNNLQSIVSREMDPADPAVVTVGRMDVGSRWNVVAEYGMLDGTFRCFSPEIRAHLSDSIERMAKATGETFRAAKVEYRINPLVPPTVNDAHISAIAEGAARKVMSEDAPIRSEKTTGGKDFAYFMEKVPGAIALLGIQNEACGAIWPQHSGKFTVDETALINGAMLYVQTAMDFNAE